MIPLIFPNLDSSPGNGYKKYVDILTGEYLSSINLAIMDLIYWSVGSSSRKGGDRLKGVNGVFVSLASYEHYFIGVDKNVEQHPSNYISITVLEKFLYLKVYKDDSIHKSKVPKVL